MLVHDDAYRDSEDHEEFSDNGFLIIQFIWGCMMQENAPVVVATNSSMPIVVEWAAKLHKTITMPRLDPINSTSNKSLDPVTNRTMLRIASGLIEM